MYCTCYKFIWCNCCKGSLSSQHSAALSKLDEHQRLHLIDLLDVQTSGLKIKRQLKVCALR
jgi:hypothetical protein